MGELVAIEVDTIVEYEGDKEEEYSKESTTEEPESLFFMELDHEEVRTNEDPNVQEYWEAGITTESLSTLKAGNVDHSQKSCYHCSRKGHIKVNCPKRRKSGAQPWTKRPRLKAKKTFIQKSYGTGGGIGQRFVHKNTHPNKWHEGNRNKRPQSLQQIEEDFSRGQHGRHPR